MSVILLIVLVVIFAVILAARRARRGPRVTHIETRRKGDDGDA